MQAETANNLFNWPNWGFNVNELKVVWLESGSNNTRAWLELCWHVGIVLSEEWVSCVGMKVAVTVKGSEGELAEIGIYITYVCVYSEWDG